MRSNEQNNDRYYRQKIRLDNEGRKLEQAKDRKYKQKVRKDPKVHIRGKQNQSKYRLTMQNKKTNINNMIQMFEQDCQQMPCYVCSVCNRQMFRKQVKLFKIQKYNDEEYIKKCINLNGLHEPLANCSNDCLQCAKWICFTCDRNLALNRFPNQSSANNLALPQQEECLQHLNNLEKHLVSPIIPFMKILPLPKGQQKGIHGPVVCVPSNLSTVSQTLPRQLSDSTLVKVKLKRKLQYKGHHLYQQVSVERLRTALEYLKIVNPHYTGNCIICYIHFLQVNPVPIKGFLGW